MARLTLLFAILLALPAAAPAAAADCFWSNGVYRCYDRSGRSYVAKPRVPAQPQQRRSQDAVRGRSYDPPGFGTGMGAFSYGCTMSRCD